MAEIMDRAESLGIFTCMIRRLTDVFDGLEKDEDLRRFGNSLGALLVQYDTILFRNRQDEIIKRLDKVEERLKDE